MKPDLIVADEGTILIFHPQTPAVREWITENVEIPTWAKCGHDGGFASDRRPGRNLVAGLLEAGFLVRYR